MSTENRTAMRDEERGVVALEATYGIAALVKLASTALEDNDDEEVVWATKEVLRRIKQLNSVIMSAVGDDGETTEELKARVN